MVKVQTLDMHPAFVRALDAMEKPKQHLFITGKAGTGKSTLLEHFCKQTKKKPVILAPTGVAAINVKGQTIHSFFNFYIDVTPQKIWDGEVKPKSKDVKLYKTLKTIIIDEISMVRADLLDCVDAFLCCHGPNPTAAFGGVHMVFVGDLYQLPPVVMSQDKPLFEGYYETPYFFSAKVMKKLPLEHIELEKVYRQKNAKFIELLNRIRNNSVEIADITNLNKRYVPACDSMPDDQQFYIHLTTTNKKADEINQSHLAELKGKHHRSEAKITGKVSPEYHPTAPVLTYKVGAQIMLLNNDTKRCWVNGTIGRIEAIKKDREGEKYLQVRLQENDKLIDLYAHVWELYQFKLVKDSIVSEPIGTFTQFPIRLAWAITIHKSQGKTFDRVIIDIGRGTFVSGQMYVALSRCTSFEGIILKSRIKKHHIRTDFRIFSFLTNYHYQQAEKALPMGERVKLIQTSIDDQQPLEMVYLKGNDTKSTRVIQPLWVGESTYQGKAFQGIRAYCYTRKQERLFRIDRILSIEPAEKPANTGGQA